MKLFLITGNSNYGVNLDFLVVAATTKQALELWQHFWSGEDGYGLFDEGEVARHDRMFEVPATPHVDTPRVLHWRDEVQEADIAAVVQKQPAYDAAEQS